MQSVTIELPIRRRLDSSAMLAFEDRLAAALRSARAGHLDGNEVGGGSWKVFLYGSRADAVFAAILPVLKAHCFVAGATVVKQYGGPNAEQRTRHLWRGRFRITQRARKPGRRPRLGDVFEFDCAGGVGFAHAVHRETSPAMRGWWVIAVLAGVHEPGSWPDLGREICRLWVPLGSGVAAGFLRVIGHAAPSSGDLPPLLIASFDLLPKCVEHGRSLHDPRFIDFLLRKPRARRS